MFLARLETPLVRESADLRVEFQNKFYKGDGYSYMPLDFKAGFEEKESMM